MIYIITIQAIAIAVCLWYIGRLWFSRRDAREIIRLQGEGITEARERFRERQARLRALLHEAAGLLMDERHRSKPRTGDSRKTDNYGDWLAKRDDVVKRIGGEA